MRQLQGSHSGGYGCLVVLCLSEGIEGLPDELCGIRLVDSGGDKQFPDLDRVEGQGVCDGLQAHFVCIKISARFLAALYSGFDGFRPPPGFRVGLRVLPTDFTSFLFPS